MLSVYISSENYGYEWKKGELISLHFYTMLKLLKYPHSEYNYYISVYYKLPRGVW